MNCPKDGAPLDVVDLPDEIRVETCPSCAGLFYDADELAMQLRLDSRLASSFLCPHCREQKMWSGPAFGGKLALEQCPKCGGVWLDKGEIRKLRDITGVEGIAGRQGEERPLPSGVVAAGAAVAAVATAKSAGSAPRASREAPAPPPKAGGAEKGPAAAPAGRSGYIDPPEGSAIKNPDALLAPAIAYEGRTYEHFQTSAPVVSYVIGEFNWRVEVGERATARDFICPPFILSEDRTGKDSTWSLGEYLDAKEVWEAFKLPGQPPQPRGVHAAQPNPHEPLLESMKGPFFTAMAACMGIFMLMAAVSQEREVLDAPFTYSTSMPEKSAVTTEFELGGRTSNVRVRVEGELDNAWAWISMALINAETDEAIDFGAEISNEHGVEDGEAWSESQKYDTVFLPAVKPGRYYLRVEPETNASRFDYRVKVMRDVPRFLYVIYAAVLLAIPFLWVLWRRHSFEIERWKESDHPKAEEDDDDDEE